MSNLLKQYFVMPQQEPELKVIDSNKLAEERIRKSLREKNVEGAPDEDGFTEGLDAPEVEKEDPEEVLAAAKAEAEAIVNAAKARADNYMSEARSTADELYARQKKEGYDAGQAECQEELSRAKAALEEEYQNKINAYYEEYEREYQRLEPELVDAIIQVFDHVFNVQFEDRRQIIMNLVDRTMHETESARSFTIRVSEANRTFLEEHLEELHSNVAGDVEINVTSDARLSEEFCRIETEHGVFDCSIDTELDNLKKDIRMLCEQ